MNDGNILANMNSRVTFMRTNVNHVYNIASFCATFKRVKF